MRAGIRRPAFYDTGTVYHAPSASPVPTRPRPLFLPPYTRETLSPSSPHLLQAAPLSLPHCLPPQGAVWLWPKKASGGPRHQDEEQDKDKDPPLTL